MKAIEVSHLTKEYRLGAFKSLKQTVLDAGAGLVGRTVPERPRLKALNDINFTVEHGEVVGIIGHNGAGKSTLLKMLAKISAPSSGSIEVNGRITPLIEVGAGFVGDFTGRENVYLNGAILGLSRKEIDRKFDEIVDFAEIAKFIDTPVKHYSSGMQIRLAFAVATSVEAEILIIDEVLAVGDLAFQRKCFDRMDELIKRQGRTVLLVSHNIRQVERLCTRVLLMNHGVVGLDGTPETVCNAFFDYNDDKVLAEKTKNLKESSGRAQSSDEIELVELAILDPVGRPLKEIEYLSDVVLSLKFEVKVPVQKPVFGIGVHTSDFFYLATTHSPDHQAPGNLLPGIHEVRCLIRKFPFLPRTYAFRVGIAVGDEWRTAFYIENVQKFKVIAPKIRRAHPDALEGFVALDTDWVIGDTC